MRLQAAGSVRTSTLLPLCSGYIPHFFIFSTSAPSANMKSKLIFTSFSICLHHCCPLLLQRCCRRRFVGLFFARRRNCRRRHPHPGAAKKAWTPSITKLDTLYDGFYLPPWAAGPIECVYDGKTINCCNPQDFRMHPYMRKGF